MEFSRPGHWSGWREVVTGPESLREDEETVAMACCMDARQDSARVAQETQWETEPVGQGAAPGEGRAQGKPRPGGSGQGVRTRKECVCVCASVCMCACVLARTRMRA